MGLILQILCIFSIGLIFLFSCHQLYLVFLLWTKNTKPKPKDQSGFGYPNVTIQLPIYNEKYVVKDLIDAVTNIRYPIENLEIQVLDDSTDETSRIIEALVHTYQCNRVDIKHIRRSDRKGFKAGALKEATQICKGDFIAIFDADFIPSPCFLETLMPYFSDLKIGMVQSRWKHLNENHSVLTDIQAFMLNGHFVVEQQARNNGGYLINFNGTAGIWRKDCMDDAGGWHDDTLTEDLDLSYRAQLKGWECIYLSDYTTPAQLPMAMSALRSQQYRWTKGAAECASKLLKQVSTASYLSLSKKVMSYFHLLNSGIFIVILAFLFASMLLVVRNDNLWIFHNELLIAIGISNISFLFLFFLGAYTTDKSWSFHRFLQFIPRFLLFIAFSLGFALHNAVAAFHGYRGLRTPFVRTPKSNLDQSKTFLKSAYLTRKMNRYLIAECIIWIALTGTIILSIQYRQFEFIVFHGLAWLGFSMMISYSLLHNRLSKLSKKRNIDKEQNVFHQPKKELVDPSFRDTI